MNTRADLEGFVRDEEAVAEFLAKVREATNDSSEWYGETWDYARLLALLADRDAQLAAVQHGLREAQRVIRACVDREECRENPDADDWRSLRKRARAALQVQP